MANEVAKQEPKAAVVVGTAHGGLIPTTFEGLWRLSQIMHLSGMMPKGIDKVEAVFVAIQYGLEVGLSPMQAVQNIAVVNGRPTLWGDAVPGLCMSSGLMEEPKQWFTGTFPNNEFTAHYSVRRTGIENLYQWDFSIADARTAGLWGKSGPWTTAPKRMLMNRARTFALRDAFPDKLKGLKTREEAMEYDMDMVQAAPGEYAASASGVSPRVIFLQMVEERAGNDEPDGLDDFLDATAKAHKSTVDKVMESATKEFTGFWNAFEAWGKKHATTAAPEAKTDIDASPEPPADPWDRPAWAKLKAHGFEDFVKANRDTLPAELEPEVRAKFERIYPGEVFPGDPAPEPEIVPTPDEPAKSGKFVWCETRKQRVDVAICTACPDGGSCQDYENA